MAIRQPIITMFPSITSIDQPESCSLLEVLDSIRSKSNPFKEIIKDINNAPHDIANNLKLSLPPICFSGEFSRRDDSAILQYSQLVCIDVDDVSDLNAFKKEMMDIPFVYSCFISPSGKGLKILVFHDCPDYNRHGDIYWHVGEEIGLPGRTGMTFDTHCSNLSRACFFSYDPKLVINPKAETLSIDSATLKPKPKPTTTLSTHDSLQPVISNVVPTDYGGLKQYKESMVREIEAFERFYSFYPGVRNRNLNILVCKLRSKGFPEQLVSFYLQLYYGGKNTDFTISEIQRCVKSVYSFKS